MIGELSILNVSAGDTKLSFDPSKPDEVKRSCEIVTDMIRRGFVLLIEVGSDEKGPIYRRAHDFNPETAEYIVAGTAADTTTTEIETNEQEQASPPKRGRPAKKGRRTSQRIPASKSKAIAVAKTAGG